MNRQALKKIAS